MVKELLSFDFWISRHFVPIFRNILVHFKILYLLKQFRFAKNFFTFGPYHGTLFQNYLFLFAITWNLLNFAVNLVTSFSRQRQLKSKNKKHRIFWNSKFYDHVKLELKQIKNAKVVPRMHFFASYGPTAFDSMLKWKAMFTIFCPTIKRTFCHLKVYSNYKLNSRLCY